MKKENIYICHWETTIKFVGTESACIKYKDKHGSVGWEIHSIEDYGCECFSLGADSGYQQGFANGQEWIT